MLQSANYLAAREHEVHVLSCEFECDALSPGITKELVSLNRSLPYAHILQFAPHCNRILNKLKCDQLSSFGSISPTGGVQWVQSVHRAWLEISQKNRRGVARIKQLLNPEHLLLLNSERQHFAARRYRKLIACSDNVRADLMRFYDVPDGDIVVVPNGFNSDEFNVGRCASLRSEMRANLGLSRSDYVFVFVANELQRKGFFPLIEAIARMKDPSLKLLVAGRVDENTCLGHISSLNLEQSVKFVGSTSDAARFYAAADCFALPTQYEAWGMVIVEALACGLPVITSSCAGAAIAVREGENGYLIDDPFDTDEIAAKLGRVRNEVFDSQKIANSVRHLDWNEVLPSYERVLLDN